MPKLTFSVVGMKKKEKLCVVLVSKLQRAAAEGAERRRLQSVRKGLKMWWGWTILSSSHNTSSYRARNSGQRLSPVQWRLSAVASLENHSHSWLANTTFGEAWVCGPPVTRQTVLPSVSWTKGQRICTLYATGCSALFQNPFTVSWRPTQSHTPTPPHLANPSEARLLTLAPLTKRQRRHEYRHAGNPWHVRIPCSVWTPLSDQDISFSCTVSKKKEKTACQRYKY